MGTGWVGLLIELDGAVTLPCMIALAILEGVVSVGRHAIKEALANVIWWRSCLRCTRLIGTRNFTSIVFVTAVRTGVMTRVVGTISVSSVGLT